MFFFVSPTLLSTHMHNSQRLDTPNSVTILINHRPQPTLDAQKKASHTVNSVGDLQKPVRRLPVEEPTEKRHASSSDAGPLPGIQPQLRLPPKNRRSNSKSQNQTNQASDGALEQNLAFLRSSEFLRLPCRPLPKAETPNVVEADIDCGWEEGGVIERT